MLAEEPIISGVFRCILQVGQIRFSSGPSHDVSDDRNLRTHSELRSRARRSVVAGSIERVCLQAVRHKKPERVGMHLSISMLAYSYTHPLRCRLGV